MILTGMNHFITYMAIFLLDFSSHLYIRWARPVNIRKTNSARENLKMNEVWGEKIFSDEKEIW
jgi:hypothetical protein